MTAYLYPNTSLELPEKYYALQKPSISIGRNPGNDISIILDSVSRQHARIEQSAAADSPWFITDFGSSNGTFVNSVRLSAPCQLNEGDSITFGRADFTFSFLPPQEFVKREAIIGTGTSSVNIVGEDIESSTILSTQFNVEATPLPGREFLAEPSIDINALKKATARLHTLYKLSEIIRSASTREEMLQGVMDEVFEVLAADRGVILTLEPEGTLEPQIVRFRKGIPGEDLTISRTIVKKCLDERVAILSRDAKFDSRFSASESILASDMRSAICVPLVSKKTMMGIFFIDTKESVHAFSEEDLAFAVSIANDLALTLDNLALTQEKIKNERLAAVGQTIAGLAHNIKNILQLAKGGIELMDGAIQRRAADEIEAYWPVVRRGIDRMQSLTQEMLDYSRQTQPELHEASVNEVIDDTIRSFMQDRVDPAVDLEVQLSPDVPVRRIHPDGLYKALLNLIGNAVDAMSGAPGRIVVSTRFDKGTICIEVEDNGKGIPKDKIGKIFLPFWTSKGSKGTGLGLPMTKKYIEDMGGTISVQSEEERGTKFTIALPSFTTQITMDVGSDAH
ncbi:MAG: ATP-binding protein [bacterium]|nr:ATP-binding protein [Candidatus Sumerlaeota bacterium]